MHDAAVALARAFEIHHEPKQVIAPASSEVRFEGIAYSLSGKTLGVAASDRDTVFLYRRQPDGLFEERPYSFLCAGASPIRYPHDLAFMEADGVELLAVAQRVTAITVFQRPEGFDHFDHHAVLELGVENQLDLSDGVAFVPPEHRYMAACNLVTGSVMFFESVPGRPGQFSGDPVAVLSHPSLSEPDGLAFSANGRWLALACHGNNTVVIYERSGTDGPRYGPEPIHIIDDESLLYPHSVAFTPADHLVVTNAGANYFSIYASIDGSGAKGWSRIPVRKPVGPETLFTAINASNKMEGGPKGVSCHENEIAICSPKHGVRIFTYRSN